MEKLETQFCIHRNIMIVGNLMGCPDCGAGDSDIKSGKKIFPRNIDPVIEKVNEIVEWINNKKDQLL